MPREWHVSGRCFPAGPGPTIVPSMRGRSIPSGRQFEWLVKVVRAGRRSDEADARATCLAKSRARGGTGRDSVHEPRVRHAIGRPGVGGVAHGARIRLSLHPPGVDVLALADDAAGEPVGQQAGAAAARRHQACRESRSRCRARRSPRSAQRSRRGSRPRRPSRAARPEGVPPVSPPARGRCAARCPSPADPGAAAVQRATARRSPQACPGKPDPATRSSVPPRSGSRSAMHRPASTASTVG